MSRSSRATVGDAWRVQSFLERFPAASAASSRSSARRPRVRLGAAPQHLLTRACRLARRAGAGGAHASLLGRRDGRGVRVFGWREGGHLVGPTRWAEQVSIYQTAELAAGNAGAGRAHFARRGAREEGAREAEVPPSSSCSRWCSFRVATCITCPGHPPAPNGRRERRRHAALAGSPRVPIPSHGTVALTWRACSAAPSPAAPAASRPPSRGATPARRTPGAWRARRQPRPWRARRQRRPSAWRT